MSEDTRNKVQAAAAYSDKLAFPVYVDPEGLIVYGQITCLANGIPPSSGPLLEFDPEDGGPTNKYWIFRAPSEWSDIEIRPRMASIIDPIPEHREAGEDYTILLPDEVCERLGLKTMDDYLAWVEL